jgi:hypothetical protein
VQLNTRAGRARMPKRHIATCDHPLAVLLPSTVRPIVQPLDAYITPLMGELHDRAKGRPKEMLKLTHDSVAAWGRLTRYSEVRWSVDSRADVHL